MVKGISKPPIIHIMNQKGLRNLPRLSCPGREAFFQNAPFVLERAIRVTKLNPEQPFFRGVFDPRSGQLKMFEVHSALGAITSVTLYANHLSEAEMTSLINQLENARLPYNVVSLNSNSYTETLYIPGKGKVAEQTELFGPQEVGITIETSSSGVVITRKSIFSKLGEPLLEEVYDAEGSLLDLVDIRDPFQRLKNFAPARGINLAYRLDFNNEEELRHLAQTRSGRIELALPHQIGRYNQVVKGQITKIVKILKNSRLEVATVHAVQDPITEDRFLSWGEEVLQLADALGAETVTLHPNNIRLEEKRKMLQESSLFMIRKLQANHRAQLAIETFPGKARLFHPRDLAEQNIPIVLDIAHIPPELSLVLMREHSHLIRTVHFSAQGMEGHHFPVDRFCLDFLEEAIAVGWRGNVVLEYLPKYQKLMEKDLARLWDFLYNPNR